MYGFWGVVSVQNLKNTLKQVFPIFSLSYLVFGIRADSDQF